jgi:hypothetical protein
MGVNVRFNDNHIARGPVFRTAGTLGTTTPRSVMSLENGGTTNLYVAYQNGRVKLWTPTTETDASISGYVDASADTPITNCVLSGVLYTNRADRVPWALTPAASAFVALANWTSTWRCGVLRAFNSSLVALNVTKGATNYQNMVKTSDFAVSGAVPPSWDESSTTNNAYENIVAEMTGAITDGLQLGSAFYIYSAGETWEMLPTLDTNIYTIRRRFKDAGAINANCVVEADSKHFVFGANDIWMHDGTGKQSIANGRVRKFIFASLQATKVSQCFVTHNPNLKEIHFCFVSGDDYVTYGTGDTGSEDGCNRSAVYNYAENKWTFDDLPRVFAAEVATLNAATVTWANVPGTWDTVGGTWAGVSDTFTKGLFYVGGSATGLTASVYAQDLYGPGSLFTFPVDTTVNPTALLERNGIDLDELNEELRGYKTVRAIYPEATLDDDGADLEFQFGSADGFNQEATFVDYQSYDGGADNYKCDFLSAGRYLFMRMRYADFKNFSLSGLDFDMVRTGSR